MSLYPSQLFNRSSSYWIPYGTISTGTTFAPGLNVPLGNISSINTQHIQLDSVAMDASPANGGTLLLNGVALVTGNNNISSIANWSAYPAISTINYADGGGNLLMNTIASATSITSPAINTNTLGVSTITAQTAIISPAVNTNTASVSTVNAQTGVNSSAMTTSTINAATSVSAPAVIATTMSTTSMTVSTINGLAYPSTLLPVLNQSTAALVAGINNFTINCSGLPAGFYLLVVSIQSGSGSDPFTCSAMLQNLGASTAGGSIHMPSISGAAPSLSNYVIIQDGGVSSNVVSVIVGVTDGPTIGSIAQISVYRLT